MPDEIQLTDEDEAILDRIHDKRGADAAKVSKRLPKRKPGNSKRQPAGENAVRTPRLR